MARVERAPAGDEFIEKVRATHHGVVISDSLNLPYKDAATHKLTLQSPALTSSGIIFGWLTLALALPTAFMLVRLFIVQHDCGHGSFFKSSKIADAVGTVLGFFFAFTAVRANLPKVWGGVLDAACLLPLISPPFTTAIAMMISFVGEGVPRTRRP